MSNRSTGPRCIVCDKAIAKRLGIIYLRSEEQRARGVGGSDWITVAELPRTIEECQKLTNHQVVKITSYYDGRVLCFTTWDGESYTNEYFDKQACAVKQGYAAAQHGHRFIWSKT